MTDHAEIPHRGRYSEDARRDRLTWLRRLTRSTLASLDEVGIPASSLTSNVENYVSSVEIPVGLAGPLLFRGLEAAGLIVAPLATTEGALVASASRGAKAITRSGGVETMVIAQRMTRVPLFEFESLGAAARFASWVRDQRPAIEEQIGAVSRHSRLAELDPVQIGRVIHLRFCYETADAGGQNMTTAATWRACQWINDRLALTPDLVPAWFAVEGNLSGDKKLTYLNMIAGRGCRVAAECFVDRATVHRVLKSSPELIERSYRTAVMAGQQAGMIGFDVNAANVIAAIFVATGQDIACVHESGAGMFSAEAVDDGLRATLVLPSLVVGTVGGGTGLSRQRDYLRALGCTGAGGARRLAEIICGFSLALNISTMAAVASGQFADAHERLGRGRRVNWLTREDLAAPLVEPLLARALEAPELTITEIIALGHDGQTSLVTDLTARGEHRKLIGVFPLRVSYRERGDGDLCRMDLVAKVKPLDEEVIIAAAKLASLCGGRLSHVYPRWRDWTGFKDVHTRELALYREADPVLRSVLPRIYGLHEDPAREAYVILMERLGSDDVILMNTGDRPELWADRYVRAAIRGISKVHAEWLGREGDLVERGWLGSLPSAGHMSAMRELWQAMADHNAAESPHWFDQEMTRRIRELIDGVGDWWAELEQMPRTLVHNDFSPRNIALRATDHSLVAYDWELATLHVPQRDLAELLAFVLTDKAAPDEVTAMVETHRAAVQGVSGSAIDRERWRRGYRLALWDFVITRLQLYVMAHTHREIPFLEHVVPTALRLLEIEDEEAGRGM